MRESADIPLAQAFLRGFFERAMKLCGAAVWRYGGAFYYVGSA
jgi:hypothetical protein